MIQNGLFQEKSKPFAWFFYYQDERPLIEHIEILYYDNPLCKEFSI